MARQSRNGEYWYFLFVNRGKLMSISLHGPENNLVVLPTLLLLCYAFARHLAGPWKGEQAVGPVRTRTI